MTSRFFVDVELTSVRENFAFGFFGRNQYVFIPRNAVLIHDKSLSMTELFVAGELVAVIAYNQGFKKNGCLFRALAMCSHNDVIETTGEVTKASVGTDGSGFVLSTEQQGDVFLPRSAVNKYRRNLSTRRLQQNHAELQVGDHIKVGIMRQPAKSPIINEWTVVKLCGLSLSEQADEDTSCASSDKESAERRSSVDPKEEESDSLGTEEDSPVFDSESSSPAELNEMSSSAVHTESTENSSSFEQCLAALKSSADFSHCISDTSDLLENMSVDDDVSVPSFVGESPELMMERFYCDVKLTSVHKYFAYGLFGDAFTQQIFVPLTADLVHDSPLDMADYFRPGDVVATVAQKQDYEVEGCLFRALSVCHFGNMKSTQGEIVRAELTQMPSFYELKTVYGNALLSVSQVSDNVHLKIGDLVPVCIIRQPKALGHFRWIVAKIGKCETAEQFRASTECTIQEKLQPSLELERPQKCQETQTEQSLETKIAWALMKEDVCFDVICRKYPDLAKEWTRSRLLTIGVRKN